MANDLQRAGPSYRRAQLLLSKPTAHYDHQSDIRYFLVRDGEEEERFVEVPEGVGE